MRVYKLGFALSFGQLPTVRRTHLAEGVDVGYDSNDRISLIEVDSKPWVATLGAFGDRLDKTSAGFLTYDPRVDALSIKTSDAEYDGSSEASPGFIIDYDQAGLVCGLEFLGASSLFSEESMDEIKGSATLLTN